MQDSPKSARNSKGLQKPRALRKARTRCKQRDRAGGWSTAPLHDNRLRKFVASRHCAQRRALALSAVVGTGSLDPTCVAVATVDAFDDVAFLTFKVTDAFMFFAKRFVRCVTV